MNNYFEEIEKEYSRARGKLSRLAPLDWQLVSEWQEKDIPLHIILRAMGDVAKKFKAQNPKNPKGTINTLRYFASEVEKQFAEWLSMRVGKNDFSTTEEKPSQLENDEVNENFNLLIKIWEAYTNALNLAEPLNSAVLKIRSSLEILVEKVSASQLSTDEIETQLEDMTREIELSLVVSIPENVRFEMLETIKRNYAKIRLDDDSRQKLLIKMAYEHFGLPRLTLFEL